MKEWNDVVVGGRKRKWDLASDWGGHAMPKWGSVHRGVTMIRMSSPCASRVLRRGPAEGGGLDLEAVAGLGLDAVGAAQDGGS